MDAVAAEVASISAVVRGVLDRARAAGAADAGALEAVRGAIIEVGRAGQALGGMLVSLVGEGDRLGLARGGMGPWLATVLDMTEGHARSLAHDARLLARVPDLEPELCSGRVGPDSARALARTVKAVRATGLDPAGEVAKTLQVTREQGARAGLERVRVLEERVDPGTVAARHAQQRERSFARITMTDGQMHRCEILLDPVRGAVFQAAVELQVAEMIRVRQFDGAGTVPEDVRSTEQMNAEAVTRLAQVFLDAPAHARGAHFSLPALAVTFTHPAPEATPAPHPATVQKHAAGAMAVHDLAAQTVAGEAPAAGPVTVRDPAAGPVTGHDLAVRNPAADRVAVQNRVAGPAAMQDSAGLAETPVGCARTVYGALIPAGHLPKPGDPRLREVCPDAHTATLDGAPVDRDPAARLASNRQREYLAWRDRHCTYPGCDRPVTFALHAHHSLPYAQGGQTTVANLRLLCSTHHAAIHHHEP